VYHDTGNISYDFKGKTKEHCYHVTPSLMFDAKEKLSDEANTEDDSKECVPGYCWTVEETRHAQVACIESTKVGVFDKGSITVTTKRSIREMVR
jgi:hypothetical protein